MTDASSNSVVLIASGGIGGKSLALILHQTGVKSVVLESVTDLKPLGVDGGQHGFF